MEIQPNVRIVGGIVATQGSYPYLVLINQYVYVSQLGSIYRLQCGGVLINRYTVLTAAHCISTSLTVNGVSYTVTTDSKYYPTWYNTHGFGFITYEFLFDFFF